MCLGCSWRDDPAMPDEAEQAGPVPPAAAPRSPAFRPGVFLARVLIRLYRLVLSPLLPNACRYLPSCSAYGEEAIGRFGFWAGGWMTLARLLRCHPLGASGFDPVPDGAPAAARWWSPWRYGRWTGRHIDPKTRLDR